MARPGSDMKRPNGVDVDSPHWRAVEALAGALSERLRKSWHHADRRLADRITAVVSDERHFDPYGRLIELARHSASGP